MIRTIGVVLGVFTFLGASPSFAEAPERASRYVAFEPCNSWRYESSLHGYVCMYRGYRTKVFTVQETEALLNRQEQRIQDLETRLAAIEQKLP